MRAGLLPLSASTLSLAAMALLFLSACNTTAPTSPTVASASTPQAQRIAEYQADYALLPATTQQQLAEGIISRDQHMKLVYMALGRPDHIVTTPNAKITTWTYRNYTPPVTSTNRTVIGQETKVNLANGSPLQDTMDAWNHKLLKREVPYQQSGDPFLRSPAIVPKAPTQSWAEYGKYREQLSMLDADRGNPLSGERKAAAMALTKRAELEYREAMMVPPIASPDPIKLDVIFIDGRVSDVMVNESFSAFSSRALSLPGINLTEDQAPPPP